MQTNTNNLAWVSDTATWQAHEPLMCDNVTCTPYTSVSLMLNSVCKHAYGTIFVQAHLLQTPTHNTHADLASVIKTLCAFNHDQVPQIVLIINAQTDVVWLRTCVSEGYQGIIPDVTWQSRAEFTQAWTAIQSGEFYWPKKIWSWYTQKKSVSIKHTFKLTPRQTQVLHMIQTRGASNKLIAKQLKISESTVKVHIGAIMKKFGVRNRTQLAVSAIQNKM